MAKSLEEIELAFQAQYPKVDKKSKSDTVSISVLDILFYLVLALMIVGAIIFSQEALGNRTIGGRHFYEVTTTSMQSVYPKDSLVFVRDIEPNAFMVGDDITFKSEDNEIIVCLHENFQEER